MTIRNAMRRMNRGIVLAAVLLAGLTGYLIYDNARFDSEKTAIKTMVTEYAGAAGDLNILPAGERVPGSRPSEAAVRKKLEENKAVLNRYLTNWIDYSSALDSAARSLEEMFKQNAEGCAYVTDCVYTVKPVKKIKKNGPRHALAEITVQVEAKTIGKPMLFTLSGSQSTGGWDYYGKPPKEETAGQEIDTKTYSYTWEFTMYDVQLEKMNGRWKIAATNGRGYMTEGKLVED